MINFVKQLFRDFYLLLNITINRNYYYNNIKSQNFNKENKFLKKLSKYVKNKFFVEIGYHYNQFNCVSLIRLNFSGLLIDHGSLKNLFFMRAIILLLKKKVKVLNKFVTLKNIVSILSKKNIGVLSIDIDGNDFWILKKILDNKIYPEVIVVEYNSSFLKKSIASQYKKNFNRFLCHSSGFYHSASLGAFCKILKKKNYYLVKVISGLNAFFVNSKIFNMAKLEEILSINVDDHNYRRAKISNLDPTEQFKKIKHLTYIKI